MSESPIVTSREALGRALHPHVCPKEVSDDHFDVIEKPGIVMRPYCFVVADSLPIVTAEQLAEDFRTNAARAWGHERSWLTTGTHVANLAAEWVAMAAEELGGEQA